MDPQEKSSFHCFQTVVSRLHHRETDGETKTIWEHHDRLYTKACNSERAALSILNTGRSWMSSNPPTSYRQTQVMATTQNAMRRMAKPC